MYRLGYLTSYSYNMKIHIGLASVLGKSEGITANIAISSYTRPVSIFITWRTTFKANSTSQNICRAGMAHPIWYSDYTMSSMSKVQFQAEADTNSEAHPHPSLLSSGHQDIFPWCTETRCEADY